MKHIDSSVSRVISFNTGCEYTVCASGVGGVFPGLQGSSRSRILSLLDSGMLLHDALISPHLLHRLHFTFHFYKQDVAFRLLLDKLVENFRQYYTECKEQENLLVLNLS